MGSPIQPTVGRVVLFRARNPELMGNSAPEVPAIITRVWPSNAVNLQVMRDGAPAIPVCSVQFDDGEVLQAPAGWRWMAYQKAVAAGEVEPTRHA